MGTNDERMVDDRLERRLRESLSAHAAYSVPDERTVPPMSEPLGPVTHHGTGNRRRHLVWAVPAAAVLIVGAFTGTIVAVAANSSSAHHADHRTAADGDRRVSGTATTGTPAPAATSGQNTGSSTASGATSASSSSSAPPATTVRVTSDIGDGATVGVGEPIVLNFSPMPTDAAAFAKAVTVRVNGKPANGTWYWEKPDAGLPAQAHYREQQYWPADADIDVSLPIGGLSAGPGKVYSGALSSVSFHTGDAHISYVDAKTLQMRVTSNGKTVKTIPVSLGAAQTPTYNGIKIVMQKGEDVPGTNSLRPDGTVLMNGPGYTNDPVQWSVRITQSGEYVHSAPWNHGIGERSTSNGCTNLNPDAAQWFYHFSQLGDVVQYTDTDGAQMNPFDGLGDWNIPWGQWQQGGLLSDT